MTDKEKIIQEIERRIHFLDRMVNTDFGSGSLDTLNEVLDLINSLPAEPPSGDLEKVATALTNEIVGELNVGDYTDHSGHNAHWHSFKEGVIAGANWQKEQLMKNVVETKVKGRIDGKGIFIDTDIPIGIDVNEDEKVKIVIVKEDKQ